ncbi:hypothetical protein EYC80_004747 [Monilinia laxa]|uniref:Uncharacterized protein n=1 Tax=Monilinia laxa TaxID=61186 RepID=A0A5N6KHY9_MONLA|nr:hypothetical protein EYC80_004747 [Monilinia laxa]
MYLIFTLLHIHRSRRDEKSDRGGNTEKQSIIHELHVHKVLLLLPLLVLVLDLIMMVILVLVCDILLWCL